MPDLSVEDVRAILADQGLTGIPEDELVETTRRLQALMAGLDRLEGSGAIGDVENRAPFEPHHARV